jgi:hypothetical protein
MSIEAMKQALKALEDTESYWVQEVCENTPAKIEQSITTLRAAIEQAEKQNPGQVEFDYITDLLWRIDLIWRILEDPYRDFTASDMEHWDEIHDAVRAALIKHEWQGLTDEEIHNLPMYQQTQEEYQLARAIEAKLKEKNT